MDTPVQRSDDGRPRKEATITSRSRTDLTPLVTAAAVFWFEALGVMGFVAGALFSPFRCWGGGCGPGDSDWFFRDGVATIWLVVLVVVVVGSLGLWHATEGKPIGRAVGFLIVGFAALAAIALSALTYGPWPLVALWTGWPGMVLVASSVGRLASTRKTKAARA